MKKKRVRVPPDVEASILAKYARRCALCFGVNADLGEKHGQIAHLDHDPANACEDNLAFLCQAHHSDFDSSTSQHKNYTPAEVMLYRDKLHAAIVQGEHQNSSCYRGGRGGNATVTGLGTAMGGMGGGGGPGGAGGAGGDAALVGRGFAMGGEGGEAGQGERGGRGGRSPAEVMGLPNILLPDGTHLWDRGRGGDGAVPETNASAGGQDETDT